MDALDLRALEIFRTVALEGSVSKAAIKLNRVQSNISTRVKQLEQQLDKQLFVRQRRGLSLTPDGEVLLGYAERLMQLTQEASDALHADRLSGVLRIGAMESTAATRLPAILARYQASHPDVQIELKTDTAGGLLRRLGDHEIEAALLAEPVSGEHLVTQAVFEEQLMLVAPRSFPALDDVAAISGKTIIAFEAGCAYRRYLDQWLRESGIVPGRIMDVSSYLAIFACVAAGTGFAVAPRAVLDIVLAKDALKCHPLPGRYAQIRTLLVHHDSYRSAKLAALQALLPTLPAGKARRRPAAGRRDAVA